MSIRRFNHDDTGACLSIFDSNVPTYFAAEERSDFEHFLREQASECAFQVMERDGRVVACGGLSRRGDGSAGFCWGMVQRALHRHGLGRELALARLRQAEADPSIKRITLSTSQHTQGFYSGLGFQVTRVVQDGHGAGIDAVEMERRV
ncbi:TPA: GNAT family N-acetyltransferase [Stenotrophomonas maltophilia]|uniref:GNAT family N-acetyltransferase n=1 Tax=Stenotrophomonas maltophilia TaxID=40324 RepID=UPI0015DDB393|nr:GNAT family N-acetyltransferase [Stenotrophomonas maltophilia]MBA0448520.1 GNAT family N-acetyltransferase [Stenotrophomonas maltophilia]HEL2977633.1 GNAT family N-acetyltransferase [Stenotrophomonas maltophilia]